MLIKQLSVFLENRLGRFGQVAKILSEAGINMKAFTVSENAEFGVLHLIVSDPEKACALLENTDKMVDDIIQETGFPDRTKFFRRFCDKTGMTPGKYRKMSKINTNKG